jgi:hypothetical protein
MKDVISKEKILKYLDITRLAMEKAAIIAPGSSHISEVAKDFFDMAGRYYSDANHFYDNDDYVNAFAAINYAHGWLDAGARLGLFDVEEDHRLFTLAK